LEAQCEQFDYYRHLQFFPWGYHVPNEFYWSYIFLVVPGSGLRTDFQLNRIVRAFRAHYAIADDRFNIFGYSGGGQFVARYMMLYPERLKRVALGGSGSFLFPTREHRYPFGMVGNVGNTPMSAADWDAKLAAMLDLPVLIFAGGADFVGAGEHPESAWQGHGQLEIALHFMQALADADQRLKTMNLRPNDAVVRARIFPLYGRDHGGAARDAINWLKENWWGSPDNPPEVPYQRP
jgi:pimeloyl-ACP methyl ester carboxylesterase